ncbi:unnamed protein product [Effrenium voratum]|uniref:Uncharacterized protein n=1 Tax=Effrenium voratum TaxID=2562239 RepID=A0AA36I5Z3_9DINO|nr:unnamed protein product [Effrenium voratum]
MFYFPYHSGFAVVQEGAPGLYTQLTRSEKIAEKFGSRMAMLNILEYQAGRDRQGEKMVEGFFCDLLVVSVESWRHLPQGIHTLTPLVRAGMTGFQGERGRGFGFSTMKDVFFVLLHEPCERKVGGQLDKDDEDGQALIHACRFMEDLQEFLSDLHAGVDANGIPDERYFVMPDNSMVPWEQVSQPHVERGRWSHRSDQAVTKVETGQVARNLLRKKGPEIESQQFSFESLPDDRFSQRSRGSLRIASATEMNRGEAGCSQVDFGRCINCLVSEFLAFSRFLGLDHVSGQPKVATSGRSTTEVRGQALVNRW